MEEFKHVIEAFQEEPSIKERNLMKGWDDENGRDYISKGICTHIYKQRRKC